MKIRNLSAIGLLFISAYAVFVKHDSLLTDAAAEVHLPAVGLQFFYGLGPSFLQAASWILAGILISAAVSLFWHRRLEWPSRRIAILIFVGGLLSVFVQLLTTEKRLVFSYFPSFALMSTGVAYWTRHHMPLVMLVSSLYFAAATHKLVNFTKMLQYIPETIGSRLPSQIVQHWPEFAIWLPKLLSFIVVPLEYTMAICLLMPRLRILGFALALTFHSLVSSFTNNADALSLVGFYVLYAHVLQFLFYSSLPVVLEQRFAFALIASVAVGVGVTHPALLGLKNAIALYLPLAVLVYITLQSVEDRLRLRSWRPEVTREWWSAGWATILLLWCLYPAIIGYRNQQYGWAMMSGAYLDKAFPCFVVDRSACIDRWTLEPQIKIIRKQDHSIFVGGYQEQLEIAREELQKRCDLVSSSLGHFEGGSERLCRLDGF
jgi:hypothetical protein